MAAVQTAPHRATEVERAAVPPVGLRRRRSTSHMLLGALLVIVCAVAFAVTSLRVDPRIPVLALAGPVSAGHVLTDADLTVVRIVPDATLGTLPESQRSAVVGRAVRLPLVAHSLLSTDVLGPAGWPPAGQSLIAVSGKAGRAPAGVTAGAQVLVLVVPTSSTTTSTSATNVQQAPAAVYAVGAADNTGATVVSLLMTSADAVRIAGATGEVALVVQGGTG
jgi:hypothetical protein